VRTTILHTPSIGATVKSLGSNVLPFALPGFKGLSKGLGFAAQLEKKAGDLNGMLGSDALSQLASMLQAGTPMAAIIDKVSAKLAKAIATASARGDDVNAQRTLQRALANALAPPGASPPTQGGLKTQVAALEQKVEDILTKLASELNTAGQKSEFSGAVLDADSKAKEIPAQQTKPPTGEQKPPAAVASFVQSLFAGVAADLTQQAQSPAPQAQTQPQLQQQLQISAISKPAEPALPDPLARILARAANADAQRTGMPAPARTAQPVAANAAFFQRLVAIVAQHTFAQTGTGSGNENGPQDGAAFSAPESSGVPTTQSQFSAQLASAPVSAVHAQYAQSAAGANAQNAYTPVDPQALIEQVVKGITMRNLGDTSEVRMRLRPEHLGDVSLKLSVSGNTITANIVAQNADVRDMLLSNQQQLARTLSEAGLSLGGFSVDVSGGNAGFTNQRPQQPHVKLGRAGAFAAALDGEDDTWADPRFGPPVLSAPNSLVLNYLV